jgi:WD40 repeat protein
MAADPAKLKKTKEISRKDILLSLARVPKSSRLFCGSSDFKVYDFDLAQEKAEPKALSGHESYVTGVAVSGKYVVSGSYDGKLIWWDQQAREKVRAVDAHARWIRDVVATPDGRIIVSVADDMVCRLWDATSGKPLRELRGHKDVTPHHFPSMLYVCAVSADSQLAATADRVGRIIVWEIESGQKLKELDAPVMYTWDPKQRRHAIGGIRSLAFSPDGKLLAAGGIGQIGNIDHLGGPSRLEVFEWQPGKRVVEYESDKFKGLIEHIQFAPGGDWLVAAGGDNGGFVQTFDVKGMKPIAQEKAPMHVHSLALDETAETLYTVGHGRLVTWELKA